MKKIRDSSEDEMVLTFLQEEIESERFKDGIYDALSKLNLDETLIRNANLLDNEENKLRKQVLGIFRGYPDKEIFENYPKIIKWEFVKFEAEDLDHIYYIDYDYWNELSKNTSKPTVAAQTVFEGIEIFDVPNNQFFDAQKFLLHNDFPPVIAYTCGNGNFLLLEGHKRMTAYAMTPSRFPGSKGLIGFCSHEGVENYINPK